MRDYRPSGGNEMHAHLHNPISCGHFFMSVKSRMYQLKERKQTFPSKLNRVPCSKMDYAESLNIPRSQYHNTFPDLTILRAPRVDLPNRVRKFGPGARDPLCDLSRKLKNNTQPRCQT